MKKDKVSISEVAEQLGVSCSTVSRALNFMPGVGDELRHKIQVYADEVGYYPNTAARNTATGRLNILSIILGDVRNPFYADLVFYTQRVLSKYGYSLTVFSSEYDEQEEIRYIRLSQRFNFSGIFLLSACTERISSELKKLDMPVVLVNRILDSYRTDSVLLDNFKAGYVATMHLIELGHSNIGFIHGPRQSSASTQRYKGYIQAMNNYGLTAQKDDLQYSDLKIETGYELAMEYIDDLPHKPTGIVIANDMTALGFISCCEEHGVEIPKMLSVVSFDDIPFASLSNIRLTTVSQHVEEMGTKAAELMIERLKNMQGEPVRTILNPTLVVRGTTLALKESSRSGWKG